MADITTLTGVDLLTGTLNVYEVTAIVDVPANIDDLDGATFISISGGLLRKGAGCTTEFNRCIIYETITAASLGTDNFSNPAGTPTSPRWNGGVTCAPIYKGCQFINEGIVARSDFDIGLDTSPQFLRDDYDAPCRVWLQPPPSYSEQADHFASENAVINGLIYESEKDDSSIEFRIPPDIQDLVLDPNAKVETVVFLMNLWAGSATYAVGGLGANYVGCFQGDATKTLQLDDPVGTPLKGHASYVDPAFWRGVLEVYRNYSLNVIDANTQLALNPRIVITADSNDAVRYDEDLTGGAFSDRLYEWGAGFEITTPTYDADYRRGLGLWGYTPSVKSFTANDDPSTMADGTILFFVDEGVTAASQAIVDAYTELETDEKLYDAIQREQLVRTDRENFVATIASSAGTAVDLQANNLVLTTAAAGGYPLEYTSPTITAYTNGNAFTLNKFNQFITTGLITFTQAATMPDNVTIGGDILLSAVTDLVGVTVTGSVDMATAGTYDYTGCTIGEVINTSGGAITIEADAGTTITTNTGPNITIIAPTITFDITVDVTAQIIIFATGTQTVIDSTTGTSLSYEYTGTPIYDVTIYAAGKVLFRQTAIQMSASGSALDVTLSNDLLYNAGHGLVWQTDFDYDRVTKEFSALTSQAGPNFYSAMIDAYIAQTYLRNTAFDMEPFGNAGMIFNEGMEFIDTASLQNWRRMGVSYRVSGVSLYEAVAIYTLTAPADVPAAAQARFQQEDGLNTQDADNTGVIDQLIPVYGDVAHGNFDYRDWLTVKYQENTYQEIYVDVVDLYQLATLSPVVYPISTGFTAVDITAGDPAISITIVDHTGAPISVGGVLFDYEIIDNGTNSGTDIEREIRYNISQGGTYQGELAYNWFADMVSQLGSGYETRAGLTQGLAGIHGFYVSRGGDDHPDFLRFQGNDESYYVPPTTAGVSAANLTAGQAWLYNQTRATTIEVVPTTVGYSRLWIDGTDADAGDTLVLTWVGVEENVIEATFSATADSVVNVLDAPDTDVSYAAYGVDGSTVTEFTFDNGNIEIDINVGSEWLPTRLYARYKYVMATDPASMVLFVGAITSPDPSLILINTALADVFLDNTNPTSIRQQGNIVFKRDDGIYPQANPTSGGGGIGIYFEGIGYTYATGSGPLTPTQEAQLANASTQSQAAAENTVEIQGAGFVEGSNSLVAITDDIAAAQVAIDSKSSQISVDNIQTDIDAIQITVDAIPGSAENADRLLGRAIQGGADGGRTVTQSLRANRNRLDMIAGLVYEEDDITVSHSYNVTRADEDAIVQMEPN